MKYRFDVDLIMTSRDGNRYEHTAHDVVAKNALEAKTRAACDMCDRNQGYFVVAKAAYRVGAVQVIAK